MVYFYNFSVFLGCSFTGPLAGENRFFLGLFFSVFVGLSRISTSRIFFRIYEAKKPTKTNNNTWIWKSTLCQFLRSKDLQPVSFSSLPFRIFIYLFYVKYAWFLSAYGKRDDKIVCVYTILFWNRKSLQPLGVLGALNGLICIKHLEQC